MGQPVAVNNRNLLGPLIPAEGFSAPEYMGLWDEVDGGVFMGFFKINIHPLLKASMNRGEHAFSNLSFGMYSVSLMIPCGFFTDQYVKNLLVGIVQDSKIFLSLHDDCPGSKGEHEQVYKGYHRICMDPEAWSIVEYKDVKHYIGKEIVNSVIEPLDHDGDESLGNFFKEFEEVLQRAKRSLGWSE